MKMKETAVNKGQNYWKALNRFYPDRLPWSFDHWFIIIGKGMSDDDGPLLCLSLYNGSGDWLTNKRTCKIKILNWQSRRNCQRGCGNMKKSEEQKVAVSARRRGHTVSTTVTAISLHKDKPLQNKLMLLNIHNHSSRVARSAKFSKTRPIAIQY